MGVTRHRCTHQSFVISRQKAVILFRYVQDPSDNPRPHRASTTQARRQPTPDERRVPLLVVGKLGRCVGYWREVTKRTISIWTGLIYIFQQLFDFKVDSDFK